MDYFFIAFNLWLLFGRHCVLGGTCWISRTKENLCTGALRLNITKEDCCQIPAPSVSWSNHVILSHGDLFYWQALAKGAPQCEPCHSNCADVKCSLGKKCLMRHGAPACICKNKCYKQLRQSGRLCGSDLKTYKHHCQLIKRNCRQNAQVRVAYKGSCKRSCKNVRCLGGLKCLEDQNGRPHCVRCQETCKQVTETKSLCGENSVTYKSLCHLRAAVCRKHKSIRIAYEGRCRANATCFNTKCPPSLTCLTNPVNQQPLCARCRKRICSPLSKYRVCGTDGVEYKNYCSLMKSACDMGLAIDTRHSGRCQKKRRKTRRRRRKKLRRKHQRKRKQKLVKAVLRSSDGVHIKLRLKHSPAFDVGYAEIFKHGLNYLFTDRHLKENG